MDSSLPPGGRGLQQKGLGPKEWAILYHASLAPSGHNSQPWCVRINDPREWVVGADQKRGLKVVDPENREMLLSIGAFLENLVQAAKSYGYDPRVKVIGRSRFDQDLARVRLLAIVPNQASLSRITLRRTVKSNLKPGEIGSADIKAFNKAVGDGFYYFPRNSGHGRLMAESAVENFKRQFENKAAMEEAAFWTRLSDRDAKKFRDGLTTDGMEINGVIGWGVRTFMKSRDVTGETWRKKAVEKVAAQAGQGGGWVVITSRGNSVADLIDTGRRFQRMALLARERNIGIHPMTQSLEEPHGQKTIQENHDASMVPQFMLRVGYLDQYPDPVSLRRPVHWFLV
ncbi:MAG: nitroreductase [Desulfobacter sp.]|nr:nitroreductase [Desulfobacter sp.]WDP84588.1 MAG: nitroreductase [Desulfobacter sp.]